jgi:hypothetical protein
MNLASGQEVIDRSPQEFKIVCLSALASLFSSSPCPFYAGKGVKKNGKATTTFISLFSSSPCPYYAGKRGKERQSNDDFYRPLLLITLPLLRR